MTTSIQHMRRRKILFLAIAGLIVASMLMLVVFNIDSPPESTARTPPEVQHIEGPGQLTPEEIEQGVSAANVRPQVMGAQRTWIQFIDQQGRLEKQYRCQALDPLPDGWSRMARPEFEAIVSDDRMITMTSDSALIHMPSKQPESGTLSGNVIIRTFEIQPGAPLGSQTRQLMEIRTEHASFDNTRGEIRCDADLLIQTETAQVEGRGLRLLFNEVAQRAEWMKLDFGTVRLSSASTEPQLATERTNDHQRREGAGTLRPASASAGQERTATTAPQPLFYKLTFSEDVRIAQGSAGWEAAGDELAVIFSLEGKSLSQSFSRSAPPGQITPVPTMVSTIVALVIGTVPAPSQSAAPSTQRTTERAKLFVERADDIVITCKGGIAMTPLLNAAERPDSVDDARFEMAGLPLRIRNPAEGMDISCRTLAYSTLKQRAVLLGDGEHPLTIDSPQMHATGERLWVNRLERTGALEGKGAMTLRSQQQPQVQDSHGVVIAWSEAVDFRFIATPGQEADASANLKLEKAIFRDQVSVTNPDIELASQTLEAQFADDAQRSERAIRSVLASGQVQARSVADNGVVTCDSLNVDFGMIGGRSVPLAMLAKGNVFATAPNEQSIWTDRLEATFETDPDLNAAAASADQRARVKRLTAHEKVQVLLADGARAFADLLEADNHRDLITLTGEDVMIVSENAVVHGGTRLEIVQSSKSASWPGPGEFIQYTKRIIDASQGPIARPTIESIDVVDNPIQLRARWLESMAYDSTFDAGAGSMTLKGQVQAQSTPNILELNTAEGATLTLQFAKPPSGSVGESRRLHTFIASGDEANPARLESRSWLTVDHSDPPRMFYIAGPNIIYDDQRFEARVNGAGEMLVRDPREAVPAGQSPTQPSAAVTGKGATSFRWSDHLHMTRANEPENQFDIEMLGKVQIVHRALDESITIVQAQELHATIERAAAQSAIASEGLLDLGGEMNIKRLVGSGNVRFDAPTRDVDCDRFEYDTDQGIATLLADGDGTVAVITQGEATPLRARTIVWNMKEDKLTISEPVGGGHR